MEEAKLLVLVLLCCMLTADGQSCVSPTTRCDCFMEAAKTIINCRHKGLTSIPEFINVSTVYDEIRFGGDNNITQIGATDFTNLKVKSIDLLGNNIASINVSAFVKLTSYLTAVYIQGNGIVDFPHQALAPLSTLQTLHLENYGTVEINSSTVMPFPVLEKLILKRWPRLRTIQPDGFRVIQNLTELTLEEMPSLSPLPVPAIQQNFYGKLSKLTVSSTGILSLYGDTFAPLRQLKEVTINRNLQLTSIDRRAFAGVNDTITHLDLDTNKLSSLGFLTGVTWAMLNHLNIGYNFDLKTLPAEIFSTMPTLEYLQCQEIGLATVDESMFRGLVNLHTLDLGFNMITNVKAAAFQHSLTLTELRLNEQTTGAIVFNNSAFSGIETSLEILNLDKNTFDLAQFWQQVNKLSNLKVLEIKQVNINSVPDRAFANNTKLESLFLSDNHINSVKQETFFGPRNTLKNIDLQRNNITTVHGCTLYDFSTKPTMKLAGNPLHCDCALTWLYDWLHSQSNAAIIALEVGTCKTPQTLASKTFNQFTRTDLCPSGGTVPNCPDLYATTTQSTTMSTSTRKPITTTVPLPGYDLIVANVYSTSIEVTWNIVDKTYVTGLKLEIKSNYAPTDTNYLGVDAKSFTFHNLRPDSFFTFCLILKINDAYRDSQPLCKLGQTKPADYTARPSSTTAEAKPGNSDSQLGIIIGASVGGVVLVGLIIAILVVLLKSNKPAKQKPMTEPVSFTMRADIPHAGGTAKHFQKKTDKEGASPDDITVNVISNGDMTNRDRISAGSYQALNEKGIDLRPMPGASHGHYTDSVEDRPLPQAPNGKLDWKARAMGHGYVNTGGASNLPETSKNEYSEVRY